MYYNWGMKDKEYYVCKHCETEREVGEMCGCDGETIEKFEKHMKAVHDAVENYGTLINAFDRLLVITQGLLAIVADLTEKLDEKNDE